MADPSMFDALRLPASMLIALDNRTYHFAMQPWHHVLRLGHVLSSAAFFGAIALLDLRLMGVTKSASLRDLAKDVLPWIYGLFGAAIVSGAMLLLYDPVKVGSHAYFMPKMTLIVAGLLNALLFHRYSFEMTIAAPGLSLPVSSKTAGAISLLFWIGVMTFAGLNAEGPPKVLLR